MQNAWQLRWMSGGAHDRSETRALVAATMVHVAVVGSVVLFGASALPRVVEQVVEPSAGSSAEIEIESVVVGPVLYAGGSAEKNPNAPNVQAKTEASATQENGRRDGERAGGGAMAEALGGPIEIVRDAPAALGLSLGGVNPFLTRGALPDVPGAVEGNAEGPQRAGPQAANAKAKQNAEAALREPARVRERALGLGPEGPVLTALSEAASMGTAPVTGRAVFLAIADGTGLVVGIDVVECSGDRASWAGTAQAARAALHGKKLRLPSTAKHAEMRIEIASTWKLPSGHDPGADISLLGGIPLQKGGGKQATKITLLDPIPKVGAIEIVPGLTVPTVELRPIAVQGDPADIGASARRVVHARLLESKVL